MNFFLGTIEAQRNVQPFVKQLMASMQSHARLTLFWQMLGGSCQIGLQCEVVQSSKCFALAIFYFWVKFRICLILISLIL